MKPLKLPLSILFKILERDTIGEIIKKVSSFTNLEALRERVRVREIWVMGASHYRNPDNDLPTDFSQKRDIYYEALHQPTEADTFIEQIKGDMRKALRLLDVAMPRILNKVKLLPNRKNRSVSPRLIPSLNPAIW